MKTAVFTVAVALTIHAGAQTRKTPRDYCAIPNQPVAVTHCEPAVIYVADFDRAAIEAIVSKHFDGFTILAARGCWHKTCENSLVIQIAGASEAVLKKTAEELRVAGKQESVLVVAPQVPRR